MTDGRTHNRCSKSSDAQLKLDLTAALKRLYMGGETFSYAFQTDPDAALADLNDRPEQFGRLRNYVGPISLKANIARVRSLARKLTHKR